MDFLLGTHLVSPAGGISLPHGWPSDHIGFLIRYDCLCEKGYDYLEGIYVDDVPKRDTGLFLPVDGILPLKGILAEFLRGSDAYVLGVGYSFEIWRRDDYDRYSEELRCLIATGDPWKSLYIPLSNAK